MAEQYKHIKTGKVVTLLAQGRMQAKGWSMNYAPFEVDMQPVMIYQELDGNVWARPMSEFHERFQRV